MSNVVKIESRVVGVISGKAALIEYCGGSSELAADLSNYGLKPVYQTATRTAWRIVAIDAALLLREQAKNK